MSRLPKGELGVGELVYHIHLNYLGVNPPLAPPPPWRGSQSDRVRREVKKKKEE
ncbi:MAG: hypothetical protein F6K18_22945 [Okeania sp. SIO2C2]|uniref:hypothetical protein n=1 Tax=Okeania sp. SIO2C2 TaxID=2607787 RepID=UPI0013B85AEC|nr:hypothetical protein [Okeania sp. SIO2C2]NEP89456.1 hypothetical protein [Okeania sp. SIO2C2]